ncbi:tRNA 5-methylaminomethyl-2-thiouridine biosynthesis bifunctional protein [Roseateles sp. YR242]|uniref:FAD-dependent 5-carboxymethylaminomethyl-2-thiouridine(34) oxidoreductase MnmC n=1 Tax=Roseateles sp. YR242 TaxID=1855305 RepID=UPI0008D55DF9|nr:FAD-dependent 5-carboxymethylaminomethyl-2-thiouridine(34) oxidoreductase MnmC [Roseateles sp. YR242]SEL21584.1 tRNA 5-methylaminomethyl-2-thiouridine biosynthesis bifunctional protein [Roseateles sp. YR242]
MKTAPIVPARVDFPDAAPPDPALPDTALTQAPDSGDAQHARASAFAQAGHVFLRGNALPGRWAGRPRFVVLETGFGLGNNFLATWAAWRHDPQRCERLIFVSIEKHPLRRDDLVQAHAQSPEPRLARALIDAWPALTPNLHTLDFEDGRVRLMLALGDARDWLPALVAQADAFYLDGSPAAANPELWESGLFKQIARLAAPGATASTWCLARPVHDALAAVGFRVEKRPAALGTREMITAFFEPRHRPPPAPGRIAAGASTRQVLVVGAGLAGAACARALSRRGLDCTVLEAGTAPAGQASGNPGGLFHGTLHVDDGPHARFNRTAALATERELRRMGPALPWLQWGLLRVEQAEGHLSMQALLATTGLPADYVQALDAAEASQRAGLSLSQPAWFFPGGGAVSPAALINTWLQEAGIVPHTSASVASLRRSGERWQACDEAGGVIAEADAVVLAAGTANVALSAPWLAGPPWPWISQRGQLSVLTPGQASALPRLPVAGTGYAVGMPDGRLCFGATADVGDTDPTLRVQDQTQNLQRLAQLLPSLQVCGASPADAEAHTRLALSGRVGWRSLVPDRLPVVGPLPSAMPLQRAEQARFWPRHPGLLICGGLASRGITWATLCGDLVAAQITGEPLPLEADLVDALDPARFGAKQRRALT